jgi:hypothetical protein
MLVGELIIHTFRLQQSSLVEVDLCIGGVYLIIVRDSEDLILLESP